MGHAVTHPIALAVAQLACRAPRLQAAALLPWVESSQGSRQPEN